MTKKPSSVLGKCVKESINISFNCAELPELLIIFDNVKDELVRNLVEKYYYKFGFLEICSIFRKKSKTKTRKNCRI